MVRSGISSMVLAEKSREQEDYRNGYRVVQLPDSSLLDSLPSDG